MRNQTVLVDVTDHVAHVRLNRPDRRNAIDGAMFAELREVALEISATRRVRAAVLSGEGGSFCSGIDTAAIAAMSDGEVGGDTVADTGRRATSAGGASPFQQVAWLWREMDLPVVAAIEGAALGAGLHIALAADVRVVAPDARIGFVEVTWGLVPDMSGTQSLRHLVRPDIAKRLVLGGETVTGAAAADLGLATILDEEPVARANEIAARWASLSPDAVRAGKRLLNASHELTVAEGLALEVATAASLVGTPNQVEAAIARFEDRAPRFTDAEPIDV